MRGIKPVRNPELEAKVIRLHSKGYGAVEIGNLGVCPQGLARKILIDTGNNVPVGSHWSTNRLQLKK